MNIKQSMQTAINNQINAELYSAYLYLAMAAYFEDQNLSGMAHWMRLQAREEEVHALKFFDYIVERGGKVTLQAIDAPPTTWASPLSVFEEAYEHEQKVTNMIDTLYHQAVQEKDPASQVMLHWFIDEQVEEEDSALTIVEKLKMIEGSKNGLYMLDKELGQREAD